jgi:hypothetical protein
MNLCVPVISLLSFSFYCRARKKRRDYCSFEVTENQTVLYSQLSQPDLSGLDTKVFAPLTAVCKARAREKGEEALYYYYLHTVPFLHRTADELSNSTAKIQL